MPIESLSKDLHPDYSPTMIFDLINGRFLLNVL